LTLSEQHLMINARK